MRIIKIILRILSIPLILALGIVYLFCKFVVLVSTGLLAIVSVLLFIVAIGLWIADGGTQGPILVLVSFGLSPLGVPLVANLIVEFLGIALRGLMGVPADNFS